MCVSELRCVSNIHAADGFSDSFVSNYAVQVAVFDSPEPERSDQVDNLPGAVVGAEGFSPLMLKLDVSVEACGVQRA